ncbi:winged helix-turn-helix domain-containing protein [Streptomyces clavuligerus]|uniref:Putative regulatory protein n=1 Tax=Streptomyces clavuligerus TaxID=1901 RepID=E2Q0W9_STRCL|nr:winged helix-turn-helix domain-containing protein [Streptomyces clavuligerus]ANW20506.1 transcriptional regulator [Streptomyces clavuligerus]AXU15132.1 winged helix family transcriptional regulator [Streptomyces clavuligerus]EFG06512.1 Putative regulatory protein [Streptomyces clavuligerus]MBY6305197.1 winged helix-turn-helix transcriptional regulator [Streptomyces clavuligerus]QCS07907.1 winged helix family transcriptional regulator [Streptomyces clavuligerus]
MANSRPFSAVPAAVPTVVPAAVSAAAPGPGSTSRVRHRLRAIDRDEVVPPSGLADVVELLPPGATWVPAPQHIVPSLPGRPPMLGYLLLVPAARQGGQGVQGVGRVTGPPQHGGPAEYSGPAEHGGPGEHEEPRPGGAPGPVRVDTAERVALIEDRALDLTYLEFELLAHLVAHPHRVHTRDHLVTTVWGYGHVGDGRTVDVHVARLRRKMGERYRHTIQTVRRVGYKYTP